MNFKSKLRTFVLFTEIRTYGKSPRIFTGVGAKNQVVAKSTCLFSAYEHLSIIGFSMIYLSAFSFIFKRKKSNELIPIFTFIAQMTLIFAFLTIGLYSVNKMQLYHLNTLSKTIVFIVLGVLLLLISFLYNKYTQSMFGENTLENKETEE